MTTNDSKYWAISSIGYGKGATIEEAVHNHDDAQLRNYGSMLAVAVTDIALMVFEPPAGVEGFYLSGWPTWTFDSVGDGVKAEPEQVRAARKQPDRWWETYESLGLAVDIERLDAVGSDA